MSSLHHSSLRATFSGVVSTAHGQRVVQYRGIRYGRIPARFERAESVEDWKGETVDGTQYGPRCPQCPVDVRHLLRIPEDHEIKPEPEDEFECLNLDISRPEAEQTTPLPVLIWIHGGSQVVTFASAASGICETSRIVTDSINLGKPIIVVSINYRLNIFAFGDGKEKNLALKDQRLGIEWAKKHIAGFGGDPDSMTLAGESAGAVYVHAQTVTGAPVKQAILSSGSLSLSPPQPYARGETLISMVAKKVNEIEGKSLREASVTALLQAQAACNVNSMWLQAEPELSELSSKLEQVEALMVGDVEYESVIWRNGIEQLTADQISTAFNTAPECGPKLQQIYQISPSRPTASKLGALDLLNDTRFALPVEDISTKLQDAQKKVYRYVFDQPSPWQASSRAHHAVDLLFLFGGVDLSFNPAAENVGRELRKRWVTFVNGQAPWSKERRFAFGPVGECKEIDEGKFAARRRVEHMRVLKEVGPGVYNAVFGALAAGRISLLN